MVFYARLMQCLCIRGLALDGCLRRGKVLDVDMKCCTKLDPLHRLVKGNKRVFQPLWIGGRKVSRLKRDKNLVKSSPRREDCQQPT